ncbi:MAG: hypothetical protein NC203_00455 [Firmicutes bacterium]|nr:hypothetical protein [[Eubacterium] siraeum]MCM1486810.1 hypothetical protein [Bacillota bacterium]
MNRSEILEIAKPILFNTEMVRAILDGRKTVTRRIIKPQPISEMPINHNVCKIQIMTKKGIKHLWYIDVVEQYPFRRTRYFEKLSPYEVGDILYVRETWCKGSLNYGKEQYYYKADGTIPHCTWKPSIHMPKEAARIFLRVTGVRVERLRDITVTGLQNEGILTQGYITQYTFLTTNFFKMYEKLWNSTVKKTDLEKYSWNANPWVWVIEFEKIEVEQ